MMQEAFRHFPKRWRFVAELRKSCIVYGWGVRSPEALVSESLQLEQWPELPLQAGRVEFECNGPDDLQLVALVRLDGDERSLIGFVREPAGGDHSGRPGPCGHHWNDAPGDPRCLRCGVQRSALP